MRSTRLAVADLLAQGLSLSEIARRLGVAHSTVGYHARRLREPAEVRTSTPAQQPAPCAVRVVRTRERVAELNRRGYSRADIARALGIGRGTVTYHLRRLGHPIDERGARRYDWAAVQEYYDAGHTVSECVAAFGFSRQTWHAAVNRGAVIARPIALPIERLCVAGTFRNRGNLKRRLIAAGLKSERCELCGLCEWRGRPIRMALHHVNGDRHDNRLENLQLVCPNCHSQTENFAGRKGAERRGRIEAVDPTEASVGLDHAAA